MEHIILRVDRRADQSEARNLAGSSAPDQDLGQNSGLERSRGGLAGYFTP